MGKLDTIESTQHYQIFYIVTTYSIVVRRIEIYSPPSLELKCWIVCHSRSIQFFSWRMHDFFDTAGSAKWFATASNDGTARLHDLGQLYSKEFLESNSGEPIQVISSQVSWR